ncbi:MAG: hypothetical protein IJ218_05900 [Alphaproteobacteria bacterium]|nr:hypothetical protein [Alphaproteobacteria bacterium]
MRYVILILTLLYSVSAQAEPRHRHLDENKTNLVASDEIVSQTETLNNNHRIKSINHNRTEQHKNHRQSQNKKTDLDNKSHFHKNNFKHQQKRPEKKSGFYLNVNLSGRTPIMAHHTIAEQPIRLVRPLVYENNIYSNNAYTCRSIKELKYCTDYRGKALDGRIVQNYGENVAYEHYKNGYQNGETSVFSADGTLVRKTNYKKSRKHGQEKVYYANGKVEYTANYKQGALEGTVLQYNMNGKQIGRMTYHNGRVQSRFCRYKTQDADLLAQIKQKNYNELILCDDETVY